MFNVATFNKQTDGTFMLKIDSETPHCADTILDAHIEAGKVCYVSSSVHARCDINDSFNDGTPDFIPRTHCCHCGGGTSDVSAVNGN